MKGMGTDEKAIIAVLGNRTSDERQKILTSYKQAYGRDLVKDLKSELSGDFEDLVVAMMMKPRNYDVYCLHKAMSGAGTDEKDLIEILSTRTNAQIKEINELYKITYKKKLESALMSETSGHFRKLLVSLNNGARDESGKVDAALAQRDAQNLYQAGEKKWGTDESAFNLVMASRNFNQLRATFDAYQKVANRDITKSLKSEMSGDVLSGMLALVTIARDAPTYFADRLKHAMAGMGTHDHDLIRAVVTRAEIDMVQIKERFHAIHHKSLENWISSDTGGDYKKLLIAIVT
jgi:annexin A7/11